MTPEAIVVWSVAIIVGGAAVFMVGAICVAGFIVIRDLWRGN